MDDEWYYQESFLREHDDTYCSEFELFGLRAWMKADGFELVISPIPRPSLWSSIQSLEPSSWENSTSSPTRQPLEPTSTPCLDRATTPQQPKLRMILTRHRNFRTLEVKPWFMPLKKEDFVKLSQRWNLPPSYLHMRKYANGCGSLSKRTVRDEKGLACGLRFVIRIPHAPGEGQKSIWSVALSWDKQTQVTSVWMDGTSDTVIEDFKARLRRSVQYLCNPTLVLKLVFDNLLDSYTQRRRNLEEDLCLLETRLGITRGLARRSHSKVAEYDAWRLDDDLYRYITKECNAMMTNQTYLSRRLDFLNQFGQFLLKSLKDTESLKPSTKDADDSSFTTTCSELSEDLENSMNWVTLQIHQVHCLRERSETLREVVYIIIAQKDSKATVQIASSTQRDSSSMRILAGLATLFLPGTFIATLFGMNMFDFNNGRMIVSQDFWLYWAVTVPLTLIVSVTCLPGFWFFRLLSRLKPPAALMVISDPKEKGVMRQQQTIEELVANHFSMPKAEVGRKTPFYTSLEDRAKYLTFAPLGSAETFSMNDWSS